MPILARVIAAIQTLTASEGSHLYKCQWPTRSLRAPVHFDGTKSIITMLRELPR